MTIANAMTLHVRFLTTWFAPVLTMDIVLATVKNAFVNLAGRYFCFISTIEITQPLKLGCKTVFKVPRFLKEEEIS